MSCSFWAENLHWLQLLTRCANPKDFILLKSLSAGTWLIEFEGNRRAAHIRFATRVSKKHAHTTSIAYGSLTVHFT